MAKNYNYIHWNYREDQMLLELRNKGYSFYKIAHIMGSTSTAIRGRYYKIRKKPPEKEINRSWCYVI